MALYDKILGIIWLFLGFALCYMSYRIGLGEAGSPGSGLIPFLTGCLLIFLSTVYLIKIFFLPPSSEWKKGFWEGIRWDKLVWVVAALIAYLFLLPILGYFGVTFIFLVFLGKLLEPQRWMAILIISTLSVAISYAIFGYWLNCQFPIGYLLSSAFF
jgi:hypothetical protein